MFSQFTNPADRKIYKTVPVSGGMGEGKNLCLVSDSRAVMVPTADHLARWLTKRGWGVTLLDLTPFAGMPHEPHRLSGEVERPYRYVKLGGQFEETNWYAPMQALCVYHWLKDKAYDVILFQHGFGGGYFCGMAKRLGLAFTETPLIAVPDDPYAFWLQSAEHMPDMAGFRTDAEIDFLERMTVAQADAVFLTNPKAMEWMQAAGWTVKGAAVALEEKKGKPLGEWLASLPVTQALGNAPSLAVCVITRGNPQLLEELQTSLRAQTFKDFEVILTDAVHAKATAEKAKGDYILFIDEDDVLLPDAMEILSRCARSGVDILTSVQGKHPHSDSTLGMRARLPARGGQNYKLSVSWIHYGANMPVLLYENIIGDTGVLIRKDVLSRLDLPAVEEDVRPGFALLVRAAQAGCVLHALPEVVLLCRTDKTGRSLRGEAAYKANKAMVDFLAAKLPSPLRNLTAAFRGSKTGGKIISRFLPFHHPSAPRDFPVPPPFAQPAPPTPVQVVLCADDHYVSQLCVTITSLLTSAKSMVDIHLVTTMNDANLRRVQAVAAEFGHKVDIISADTRGLPVSGMWGQSGNATYWRLGLPDYLPQLNRVIYLDCDIVVRRDLGELWAMDLGEYYLAAARDRFPVMYPAYARDFGGDYFNAGVMVINLAAWRRDNIAAHGLDAVKAFEAEHYPYTFHDQSPLNKVVNGHWRVLHPSWNFYEGMRTEDVAHFHLDTADLDYLKRNAAICHFLGPQKPWQPGYPGHSVYGREYCEHEEKVRGVWRKVDV